MKKTAFFAVIVCLGWALTTVPYGYTDDAPSDADQKEASIDRKAEAAAKQKKFRPRLPNYYGQIGLADSQRKAIYGIQREYFYQIAKLEAKIAILENERDQRIYNVLSPLQKKLLAQRLQQAKKRREQRRKERQKSQSNPDES